MTKEEKLKIDRKIKSVEDIAHFVRCIYIFKKHFDALTIHIEYSSASIELKICSVATGNDYKYYKQMHALVNLIRGNWMSDHFDEKCTFLVGDLDKKNKAMQYYIDTHGIS